MTIDYTRVDSNMMKEENKHTRVNGFSVCVGARDTRRKRERETEKENLQTVTAKTRVANHNKIE